ncbi:MAG TPA: DUF3237 domain-containing protein [Candidatus Binatia bacterium]|nr:DUF3237 domain-containing protein [Candidatus Binatia bacterium]
MSHPSTQVTTEYVMTLHAPLDPPQGANADFQIFNVRSGGWVRGPSIRGVIIPPSGDWLRIMPGGARRLDVRLSIRTDDGAIVFVSYAGRAAAAPADAAARLAAGETLGPDQVHFVIAPTFETAAPSYAWLNDIVAVGKVISLNRADDRHVTYDIFTVR